MQSLNVKTMDKLQNFVIWLDGYIQATGDDMNVSQTNVVRNKLDALFAHEADALQDKPTLEELGAKHEFPVYEDFPPYSSESNWSPNNSGLDGTLYRC